MAKVRKVPKVGRRVVGFPHYPHFEDCPLYTRANTRASHGVLYLGDIAPCCGANYLTIVKNAPQPRKVFRRWEDMEFYM